MAPQQVPRTLFIILFVLAIYLVVAPDKSKSSRTNNIPDKPRTVNDDESENGSNDESSSSDDALYFPNDEDAKTVTVPMWAEMTCNGLTGAALEMCLQDKDVYFHNHDVFAIGPHHADSIQDNRKGWWCDQYGCRERFNVLECPRSTDSLFDSTNEAPMIGRCVKCPPDTKKQMKTVQLCKKHALRMNKKHALNLLSRAKNQYERMDNHRARAQEVYSRNTF